MLPPGVGAGLLDGVPMIHQTVSPSEQEQWLPRLREHAGDPRISAVICWPGAFGDPPPEFAREWCLTAL